MSILFTIETSFTKAIIESDSLQVVTGLQLFGILQRIRPYWAMSMKMLGWLQCQAGSKPSSLATTTGNIYEIIPGHHGFHVHALGDTTNGCMSHRTIIQS
uniref:Superoxide dismutase n=1 Tax=Quercus lobata TaxID=97700 RepID=A0A7N2LAQ3_QUELO